MSKMNTKLAILSRIHESKDILFGQFSSTLTKKIKVEEWKKICSYCKAVGVISQEKDYSYVRDVFWSNIKRTTLAKRDNAKQTGSGGGKKFTPIDAKVMEIIGKDSPILKGLGQKDYMEIKNEAITDPLCPSTSQSLKNDESPEEDASKNKKLKRNIRKENTDDMNKKRKLELQLEHLELINYKTKLEILAMERQLNIPQSSFTQSLIREDTRQDRTGEKITQENSSNDENRTQNVYYIVSENNDTDLSE